MLDSTALAVFVDPREDPRLMDGIARGWTARYIAANLWRVSPGMDADDLWQVANIAWFRFCPGSQWFTQRDGTEHAGWYRSGRGMASRMNAYKLAFFRDVCSLAKGATKCGTGRIQRGRETACTSLIGTGSDVTGAMVLESGVPVNSQMTDDERKWTPPATPPGMSDAEWVVLAEECPDLVELYRAFVVDGVRPRKYKRADLQAREVTRCVDSVLASRGLRPRVSTISWLLSKLERSNADYATS